MIEIDLTTFLSIVSGLVSAATLLVTVFKVYVSQERRITRLETKMELFWDAVSGQAAEMLHHPTTPRKDELLRKLKEKTLTISELEELEQVLQCDIVENRGTVKAFYTAFVLSRVRQLLLDRSNIVKLTEKE